MSDSEIDQLADNFANNFDDVPTNLTAAEFVARIRAAADPFNETGRLIARYWASVVPAVRDEAYDARARLTIARNLRDLNDINRASPTGDIQNFIDNWAIARHYNLALYVPPQWYIDIYTIIARGGVLARPGWHGSRHPSIYFMYRVAIHGGLQLYRQHYQDATREIARSEADCKRVIADELREFYTLVGRVDTDVQALQGILGDTLTWIVDRWYADGNSPAWHAELVERSRTVRYRDAMDLLELVAD